MPKNALCLISHYPNPNWMDFLNNFTYYDIFIIVDDNSQNYQDVYGVKYKHIKFIQIDNEEYKNANYIDRDFLSEVISGWHKSLYYFSKMNTTYDNVWFFEDDVFFYNEKTLLKLDSQYPDTDLLSQELTEYNDVIDVWHWYKITMNYPKPFYNTMVCMVRMSKNLLQKILDYSLTYNTLFFIEAMFPTLCIKNQLSHESPPQFHNIFYRHEFDIFSFNKDNLYHPIKRPNIYPLLREYIHHKTEKIGRAHV